MHCPHCGQQQVSDVVRFCSRCGFPLEGVIYLLANGGALPSYQPANASREISPRRKGVKQGALLILIGAILVPLLGVLFSFTSRPSLLEVLIPLAAIIFFVGGPLRMLYAALFEEGAPRMYLPAASYAPPPVQMPQPVRQGMLPPPAAAPPRGWRSNTAELVQPHSVTENTTRLLDKQANRETDE